MAELTQTAANVGLTDSAGAVIQKVTYGEAITQGNVVYKKTADSEYYKADADAADTASADGIALTAGGDSEEGVIITSGPVDVGATLTVGTSYYLGTTAGAIGLESDLSTGDFPTYLGNAIAADTLDLQINVGTVAKA